MIPSFGVEGTDFILDSSLPSDRMRQCLVAFRQGMPHSFMHLRWHGGTRRWNLR